MLPAEKNFSKGWLVREEAETDWNYGERPEQRNVEEKLSNGVVIIDKPSGIKSHKLSVNIKKSLKRSKAGHSGTLDPDVTGVLPVGLDNATKVLQALKNAGKKYVGTMRLSKEFSTDEIEEVAETFLGTVKQVPPEISAVKREEREREVYGIEILDVSGKEVEFMIECEKGFYVRVFCEQFGERIGAKGRLEQLRRTKVGLFTEKDCFKTEEVEKQFRLYSDGKENDLNRIILPVEAGVKHLKKVLLKDTAVAPVCHGASLGSMGISKLQEDIEPGELVALLTLKGELVAVGNSLMTSEKMVEVKDTAVELKRVFMDKDVYPKKW